MIRLTDKALCSLQFNRANTRAWVGFIAVALATGFMVGCGGDDEPVAPPAADDGEQAAVDDTPAAPPQQAAAPRTNNGKPTGVMLPGGMGQPAGGAPATTNNGKPTGVSLPGMQNRPGMNQSAQQQAGPPPEPPRSADFAAWSKDDYKNAVRERDQAIVGAVEWLATNKQDDASAELLIELLGIAKEPAKQPPGGGTRGPGGRPGGRQGPGQPGGGFQPPSGGGSSGDSGAAAVGSLDSQVLQDVLMAGLSGRLSQLLTTSLVIQNGPPPGYGQNGQNGPPAGYGQNGPPEGYGQDEGQNGPPPGYGNGPPAGYGQGGGQNGPPEGYGGSGAPPGYGDQSMDGPPPGYNAGGGPGGSGGAAAGGAGRPGGAGFGGGGLGGRRGGNNNASFAHYGTLDMDKFVDASVAGLIKIDSPKAWEAIDKLLNGSMPSPKDPAATSELVLQALLNNYGGPGHPTHKLLIGLVMNDSPQSAKAIELFTDYAGTAIEQLLGLVEPASEGGGQQVAGNGRNAGLGGNGRSTSLGGGNGRTASFGGGNAPSFGGDSNGPAFGGGGAGGGAPNFGGGGPPGRSAGFGGGNNNGGGGQPAANAVSLSMNSQIRPMTSEQLRNITTFLWHADFSQAVATKLGSAPTLAEGAQLLALAGNLPTQIARQAYMDVLNTNQATGPDSLTASGFFNRVARDPGMLVVMKSMSQQKRSPGNVQSRWDEATKDAALALRDRLKQASANGGVGAVPSSLIRLHKGAEPAVVFNKQWPRDIGGAIGPSKCGTTGIVYIRLREPADERNLKALERHYSARISANKKVEKLDKNRSIVWLTGMRTLKTGMRRSMDVIFSQDRSSPGGQPGGGRSAGFGGGGGGGGAASGHALIEIIIVDNPNPNMSLGNASLDK